MHGTAEHRVAQKNTTQIEGNADPRCSEEFYEPALREEDPIYITRVSGFLFLIIGAITLIMK